MLAFVFILIPILSPFLFYPIFIPTTIPVSIFAFIAEVLRTMDPAVSSKRNAES